MKGNLLLLHGALGSKRQFASLAQRLSKDFYVHSFDFSGHGGRSIDSEFSVSSFVTDTLEEIQRHHLAPVFVFGYSMGGYVALQAARDQPEKFLKIMTLGTKFHWDPESAAKEVGMMNPNIIAQKIPAFAESLRERHHPADWKEIMRLTGDMMLDLGDGSAMTVSDFQRIPHEVLLCIGSRDQMVTIDETENVALQLPNGKCKVLENVKHPIEQVDENLLYSLMMDFFN